MSCLLLAALAGVVLASSSAPAQEPAASGTLLVLNKSDHTLLLLDPDTGARRAELPTGRGPHEVAVSPDGRTAVVADYGDRTPGHTLTVVDLLAGAVTRTLDLAPYERPHGLAFLPDGEHLVVTSETSGALLLVDLPAGRVVAELPTAQAASHMVVLRPDASRAFVANITGGSVTAFDLRERTRLAVVPTGAGAEGLDVTPDGRLLLVGNREADTLSFVDAETLEEIFELPCGRFPIRVKVTPDGRHALVSCAQSGEVAVVDVAARAEVARIPMGTALREEEGGGADGAGRMFGGDFSDGPVPIGILITPDGRRAFVASTNRDLVTVLDLSSRTVLARLSTGREPDGLGWTPRHAPAPADAESLAQAIAKLGGTVERDDQVPGRPIVAVDLHGTAVTDADLALLARQDALHTLDLRLTSIGDPGLQHLRGLTGLRSLNLFRTRVTDAGLAAVTGNARLETLLLGGTAITDAGLAQLSAFPHLRKLSVFDTAIGDAGLEHLAGLAELQIVLLGKSQVTDAGREALQAAHPGLSFSEPTG